jgi:DNA-3-methyladenine glycosylase
VTVATERLPRAFFDRDVVRVARDLVGCTLEHDGAGGVIVETEAYHHSEPASHAYVGLTARTSTLFGAPGTAYVYRSYGIHALFNVVCEHEDVGAGVLIRALEPTHGLELMALRRGRAEPRELCSGPGKLTQALAIELSENATDLVTGPILLGPRPPGRRRPRLVASPRIGITKGVELPWRFSPAGDPWVSRPRPVAD